MNTTVSVLEADSFDMEAMKDRIAAIHVPAFNHLVFHLKNGETVERIWQDKSRRDSWTPEMKQRAAEHAKRRRTK